MKLDKIYTRTGDKGITSLVGGVRVPKTHARLEAYGTVDELNACIGWLITVTEDEKSKQFLQYIQHKLFSVGSYLATDPERTEIRMESRISEDSITKLEKAIDEINSSLPALSGFILPGGSQAAAVCHVCRTVCRRSERRILALETEERSEILDEKVKRFMNRLSDYLFVLSRKLNDLTHCEEIYWDKNCE